MKPPEDLMRVQKFLARCGLCSRRQAEDWIADGLVAVNGAVIPLGAKVDPRTDRVTVRGRPVHDRSPSPRSFIMHKPRGYLCSNRDPHHDRTVFDLLAPSDRKIRLYCAGRLDRESEGLIILTNDGDLAHRITHPRSQVRKRYRVFLDRPFDSRHAAALCRGVRDRGEHLKVDKVLPLGHRGGGGEKLEVQLCHGKKREIRRLFAAFGYRVAGLKRVQIGRLVLRGLGPGRYRPLKSEELRLMFASSRA